MKGLITLILLCCFTIISGQTLTQQQEDEAYTIVEQMPEFPGGEGALNKFIQANLIYPQPEKDSSIQGRVVLRLVIDEAGAIAGAKILKGVSENIDKEALRIVKLIPAFKPGRQGGKAVKVKYNLVIPFRLW